VEDFLKMSEFRAYAERLLNEEKVSSKLIKSTIDLLHDFIYHVKAELSSDERKQVVDNLEVSVDSMNGDSVSLNGTAEFVKNGKYNKTAKFSVELKFEGIESDNAQLPVPTDTVADETGSTEDMGGEEPIE